MNMGHHYQKKLIHNIHINKSKKSGKKIFGVVL